jgi:hypothetical protein
MFGKTFLEVLLNIFLELFLLFTPIFLLVPHKKDFRFYQG